MKHSKDFGAFDDARGMGVVIFDEGSGGTVGRGGQPSVAVTRALAGLDAVGRDRLQAGVEAEAQRRRAVMGVHGV